LRIQVRIVLSLWLLFASLCLTFAQESVKEWKKRAQAGDAGAMLQLARHLEHKDKDKDKFLSQAVYWYKKAAEMESRFAQYNMGVLYFQGRGVQKDLSKAFFWLGEASVPWFDLAIQTRDLVAKQLNDKEKQRALQFKKEFHASKDLNQAGLGSVEAMLRLAYRFERGIGFQKDLKQALQWTQKAVQQGFGKGYFQLGRYHEEGIGVKSNPSLATDYYWKAALRNVPLSMIRLSKLYFHGMGVIADKQLALALLYRARSTIAMDWEYDRYDGLIEEIESELSPEEIKSAQNLSQDSVSNLKRKAAHFDLEEFHAPPSRGPLHHFSRSVYQFDEASPYFQGFLFQAPQVDENLVVKDYIEARFLAKDPRALFSMGLSHLSGKDVAFDLFKSRLYLEQARELGSNQARDFLIFLDLVHTSKEDLSSWSNEKLNKARENSNPQAFLEAAYRLEHGRMGVAQSYEAAYDLYLHAARLGSNEALRSLARMEELAKLGTSNPSKAYIYLSLVSPATLSDLEWLASLESRLPKAQLESLKEQSKQVLTPIVEESPEPEPEPQPEEIEEKVVDPLAELRKKSNSGDLTAGFQLAQALLKKKESRKEGQALLESVATGGNLEAKSLLASSYEKGDSGFDKDLIKAAELYQQLHEMGMANSRDALLRVYTLQVQKARAAGENKQAVDYSSKLLEINGMKEEVNALLLASQSLDGYGLDLVNEKKSDQAQAFFEKSTQYADAASKLDPNSGQVFLQMAVSTGNLARFKGGKEKIKIGSKVEGYCKKAIELNPNLGRPYAILGTYYWEVSKLPWLLKSFARSFLGNLPDKTPKDALELYKTSVSKEPDQIYANYKIAQMYLSMNKKAEARKHLEKLVSLKSDNSSDARTIAEGKEMLSKL